MPLRVYNSKHKGDDSLSKRNITVMPGTQEILSQMGEQIKLARLRRELSAELVAERAGISRATLWNIMDRDLLLIAKDDEFGRKLQDLGLLTRKRAPKRGE